MRTVLSSNRLAIPFLRDIISEYLSGRGKMDEDGFLLLGRALGELSTPIDKPIVSWAHGKGAKALLAVSYLMQAKWKHSSEGISEVAVNAVLGPLELTKEHEQLRYEWAILLSEAAEHRLSRRTAFLLKSGLEELQKRPLSNHGMQDLYAEKIVSALDKLAVA